MMSAGIREGRRKGIHEKICPAEQMKDFLKKPFPAAEAGRYDRLMKRPFWVIFPKKNRRVKSFSSLMKNHTRKYDIISLLKYWLERKPFRL